MSKHEHQRSRFYLPRWAIVAAVVMISVGVVLLATREARERLDAVAALAGCAPGGNTRIKVVTSKSLME
jgi:hypothetical protein